MDLENVISAVMEFENQNGHLPGSLDDLRPVYVRDIPDEIQIRLMRRFEDDTGRIEHAEVQIDDTIVMIGDPGPGGHEQMAVIHVYVPDVDATYQKALKAGATGIQAPVQKGDPDKRGGVEDPAGNTWWVSTQMDG